MDSNANKSDNTNQVSLPGAGETEPTVLQELNRAFVNPIAVESTETNRREESPDRPVHLVDEPETKFLDSDRVGDNDNQKLVADDDIDDNVISEKVIELKLNSDIHGHQPIESKNKSEKSEGVAQQGQTAGGIIVNEQRQNTSNESESLLQDLNHNYCNKTDISISDVKEVLSVTENILTEQPIDSSKCTEEVILENLVQEETHRSTDKLDHSEVDSENQKIELINEAEKSLENNLDEKIIEEKSQRDHHKDITEFTETIEQAPLNVTDQQIEQIEQSEKGKSSEENTLLHNKPIQSTEKNFTKIPLSSISASVECTNTVREISPPPVPLDTYRWEDVRRSKKKGGYPWTYLDDPEIRQIKHNQQKIDPVKLADKFEDIDLNDREKAECVEQCTEDVIVPDEAIGGEISVDNHVIQPESVATELSNVDEREQTESKATTVIKGILKRVHPKKIQIDQSKTQTADPDPADNSPKKPKCCHPFVEKLKTMADKQLTKAVHLQKKVIKKVHLKDGEKIDFHDHQEILRLKESPKADRKEIASYIVKQDSDDALDIDIVALDESPSEIRKRRNDSENEEKRSSIVIPDEIIEIPRENGVKTDENSNITVEESVEKIVNENVKNEAPKKAPRKKKEHVYEEIVDEQSLLEAINEQIQQSNAAAQNPVISDFLSNLSLDKEDEHLAKELQEKSDFDEKIQSGNLLQPLQSSIDSASSDDERKPVIVKEGIAQISKMESTSSDDERREHLPALQEESDYPSDQDVGARKTDESSDKKVSFTSTSGRDASEEPHREDVVLANHLQVNSRWSKISDHEYEPIGEPVIEQPVQPSVPSVTITQPQSDNQLESIADESASKSTDISTKPKLQRSTEVDETVHPSDNIEHLNFEMQGMPDVEPTTEDTIDMEDIEPSKPQSRAQKFLSNANDRRKHMNQKLKTQAGKLQTKFKSINKPKSESPKKIRRKFKTPEFSKLKNIQMPKINKPEFKRPEFKRPEMPKFKTFEKIGSLKKSDFKINLPERPKFSKPEMPKFKLPEQFSSLKLRRSKSLKSNRSEGTEQTENTSPDDNKPQTAPTKKIFDFGTYPRIFDRRKKPKQESETSRDGMKSYGTESSEPQFDMNARVIRKSSLGAIGGATTSSSFADTESGQFRQFDPDGYSMDRETSVERRMKLHKQDSTNSEDQPKPLTEEQKILSDYNEENRTIHQISKLREKEFKQRKPLVHQESDLVSEESGKDFAWEHSERLRDDSQYRDESESISQKEDYSTEAIQGDRLSVQETQSSGSFKKGVIEEIDDDEFFLRKKGISQDDIQFGRYISSAIREGLDSPENSLAKLGQYDSYYDEDFDINNHERDFGYDVPPRKPRRVKEFGRTSESFNDDDSSLRYADDLPDDISDQFRTFPPKRPTRKSKKQFSQESLDHDRDHEVPVAVQYYPHPDEGEGSILDEDNLNKFSETLIEDEADRSAIQREIEETILFEPIAPPRAPKRRKKLQKIAEDYQLLNEPAPNGIPNGDSTEILAYRAEHEYIIPLAQPENFATPTPMSRSRSRVTDDDRTSRGADSLIFDDMKFTVDLNENNGYAVVKKEPPPRPPAPIRRKRSTRSLGDRHTFTVPRERRIWDSPQFERNSRNYSTIGPTRPPRRTSVEMDNEDKRLSVSNSDVTQYEEIDDFDKKHLEDTEILNKMKYRPLPPPPRPPRERKSHKSIESEDIETEIKEVKVETPILKQPDEPNDLDRPSSLNGKADQPRKQTSFTSQVSSQEIEEVEVSTQTDPLPDDFCCEEFEITDDMKTIEPTMYRKTKTLEEILKEEQEAELERAKQIADEQCLTKSLQKFRDASQKSLSERSRGSTDRPKTPGSRPITPSAILIERKIILPTTETDAALIVQPIEIESDSNLPDHLKFAEDAIDTEDERIVNEALRRYKFYDEELRDSSRDPSPPKVEVHEETPTFTFSASSDLAPITDQEDSINDYRSSALEDEFSATVVEHDFLPKSLIEPLIDEEPEHPPQAPPRRRSTSSDVVPTTITNVVAEMPVITEQRVQSPATIPDPPLEILQSGRMHIVDLEVGNLNVSSIQAGRISVSDLQATGVSATDLESKSGDLVVKNITLPPHFIDELIERLRESNQSSTVKTETVEETAPPKSETQIPTESIESTESVEPQQPPRPPPPKFFDPSEYSIPPASFYQLRDYYEDEPEQPHIPPPVQRRRRHYRRRGDHSTSDDDREERRHTSSRSSGDPSIMDLTGQLVRACGRAAVDGGSKLVDMVRDRTSGKDGGSFETSKEAVIIVIVILILLVLSISGDRTVHHHHWDYFNPPDSSASK